MYQDPDLPKILIFGTSYISSIQRKDDVILWSRLNRRLNPNVEMVLVDSNSPFDPRKFFFSNVGFDANTVIHMEENIGHPTSGLDGWGRDFCFGIDYAISRDFDWVVFIESDLMFYKPVTPIIQKMMKTGVLFACPLNIEWTWIETGLMFLSVPALRAINFVEKYAWEKHNPGFQCEPHVEKILSDELFLLPLRGFRNDKKILNEENLQSTFPCGLDYLTHATPELYNFGMKLNGIDL